MRSVGWTGERWAECGLCGFDYPMSKLTKQRGLLVCTVRCLDKGPSADPDTYPVIVLPPVDRQEDALDG